MTHLPLFTTPIVLPITLNVLKNSQETNIILGNVKTDNQREVNGFLNVVNKKDPLTKLEMGFSCKLPFV